ncbi:MAG: flavodoxin family protein [Oscillospiraceae bacterium]|nr:flavodoxin family protein [Oscillospiraceae bacterium]
MKVIAINGSPRKGWNTDMLLQEALKGAVSAGADTEIVHLYDLNYTGCKSCFACKRKDAEDGYCRIKDELTPVLEKILSADAVIMGSPIYFGDVTGQMICLLERLGFPLLSYDDYSKKLFSGKTDCAFFFTMNVPQEYYEMGYKQSLEGRVNMLKKLNGNVETLASCDTLQFSDYSKYHAGTFDEAHKKEMRATQFEKDLRKAFEIGKKLAAQ